MVRRRGLPEINELVVVKVYKVTQFAAWCKLEEYPELEGIIPISEAAGKWIFDVREVVKEGKQYVAKVIRIDEKDKIVKLSLKRVSKRDEKEKLNLFRKELRAEKILELIAESLGKSLDEAYENIGFLLQEKFGEMYDGLERIFREPKILDKLKIKKEWKDALLKVLKKTFREKWIELKVNLQLYSLEGDGICRVKKVLESLSKKGLEVKYISPPRYLLKLKTTNPKKDEKKLLQILKKTEKLAKQLGCYFSYSREE